MTDMPKRNRGPSGRRRTLAQIDKDNKTLMLHLEGKTYHQIMEIQGFKSMSSVHYGIKRALLDRQKAAFEGVDHFTVALESVQAAIAKHEAIVAADHYVVSTTGKLVLHPETGEPIRDPGPAQRSLTELRHLYDQRNKLQGNYAPTKVRQQIVPEDVVDQEIARLAQKLSEAGKNTEVPTE